MIYLHGVSESDVVSQYPRQRGSEITETSQGLNLPLIRKLISQGASFVNASLEKNGYSDFASQLSDNAKEITGQAVITYAVWHCLLRVNAPEASTWQALWESHLDTLRRLPEYLGASQNASDQVISNISETPRKRQRFGRDFTGW